MFNWKSACHFYESAQHILSDKKATNLKRMFKSSVSNQYGIIKSKYRILFFKLNNKLPKNENIVKYSFQISKKVWIHSIHEFTQNTLR